LKSTLWIFVALLLTAPLYGEYAIQYAGTGHWYEAVYVDGGVTWTEAHVAALAAGGYLATVDALGPDPAGENAFIFGLVSSPVYWNLTDDPNSLGPWLGGYQIGGSPEPSGGWVWADRPGEALAITGPGQFWRSGEPSNGANTEGVLQYFGMGKPNMVDEWNDINEAGGADGTARIQSYVIEWDTQPGSEVPEPATWTLVGVSVLVAGIARRSLSPLR
jgi:hypothetical protein